MYLKLCFSGLPNRLFSIICYLSSAFCLINFLMYPLLLFKLIPSYFSVNRFYSLRVPRQSFQSLTLIVTAAFFVFIIQKLAQRIIIKHLCWPQALLCLTIKIPIYLHLYAVRYSYYCV